MYFLNRFILPSASNNIDELPIVTMPTVTIEELLRRNKSFAGLGHIPRPLMNETILEPAHTIIVSCFDDRSAPEHYFQINIGNREVVSIRNAGGLRATVYTISWH